MNNEYPKMMYCAGGSEPIHGGHFSTKVVDDAGQEEAALADGWHLTTTDATITPEDDDEGRPATHAELKQKASELGLTFAHNTSKAVLAEMIEQKLAAKD